MVIAKVNFEFAAIIMLQRSLGVFLIMIAKECYYSQLDSKIVDCKLVGSFKVKLI